MKTLTVLLKMATSEDLWAPSDNQKECEWMESLSSSCGNSKPENQGLRDRLGSTCGSFSRYIPIRVIKGHPPTSRSDCPQATISTTTSSLSRDSPGSQASEASLCCVHQRSLQVQGQLASATAVSGRVPALTLQISDSQLSSPLSVNPWTTKWVFLFVLKLELLIFDASAVITCLPKYFRSSSSSRWWWAGRDYWDLRSLGIRILML